MAKTRSDIEVLIMGLEAQGYHVTDVKEERAVSTETGHVIDDRGMKPTGAILIRVVPTTQGEVQS